MTNETTSAAADEAAPTSGSDEGFTGLALWLLVGGTLAAVLLAVSWAPRASIGFGSDILKLEEFVLSLTLLL